MDRHALARALATSTGFAYPILAHLAVIERSRALTMTALGALCTAMILPSLARPRWLAWLSILPIAVLGTLLARAETPQLPLYVAPVLVPAFMAWIFGRTLTPGGTPLIAQLVRILHPDGDAPKNPEVWIYARKLTLFWASFFAAIASINFILALLAKPNGLLLAADVEPFITIPQHWWSLFANFLGYALAAVFFVGELFYRRWRFPDEPHRGPVKFIREVSRSLPKLIRGH